MTPSTADPVVGTPFTVTTTLTDPQGGYPNVDIVLGGFGSDLAVQSAGATSGSCTAASSGTYTCAVGTVTAGTDVVVTTTLLPTAAGSATLSAQVVDTSISSPSEQASFPSTSTSVTVGEPPAAELSLRIPSATMRLRVGARERLGIVVGNGGSRASATQLTVVLPATTKVVAAVPRSGSCAGRPIVCSLGELAPQGTNLVVLTVQAEKPGTGQVVATLSGTNTATGASIPSGSLTIVVSPRPPARTTKR